MPIIHLVGPNAIGKTTAVVRWGQKYGGLKVVSLDLLRKPGYDTKEEKAARCQEWKESDQVVVVESARTSQLTIVSCDSESQGITISNNNRINGYRWKGTQDEKKQAVEGVRDRFGIVVCESARTTTTTTSYSLPDEPVILLTCPGEILGRHLRARCEAKGKRFRDDYWDQWKLDYESSRRYLNFAAKNLRPEQVRHFEIKDQARDWPVVDEYFGSLYRRMHNELIRNRK